jgi:hypothetical protein
MGLGDVARKEQARRAVKKPARVFTNEDLEDQEMDTASDEGAKFYAGKKKGEYTFSNKDLGVEAEAAREKDWDTAVGPSKNPKANNRNREGFSTPSGGIEMWGSGADEGARFYAGRRKTGEGRMYRNRDLPKTKRGSRFTAKQAGDALAGD